MSATTDNHQRISDCVAALCTNIRELQKLMSTPDNLYFGRICDDFEELERAFRAKTAIDASFAYLADRDDAGRRVNSSRAVDYLTARLRLTYSEAMARLTVGAQLFGPPEPEPEPEPEPAPEDLGAEEAAEQERLRQEAEENRRKEEEAKEQIKNKLTEGDGVRPEVLSMIERELKFLNANAKPGRKQLYAQAIEESERRNLQDLRTWLRDKIRKANKAGNASNKDPHAATKKRCFTLGKADSDGGCFVNGYVDAATAAMLAKALSPAARPGGPDLPPEEDTRTAEQRRADVLSAMVHSFLNHKEAKVSGAGSIIISATLDELDNLSPDTLLPTNTGHMLSVADIVRLGAATSDYLCIFDSSGVMPLALGRSQRTASFAQKLALIASELTCSHPGCSVPAINCDVHHLQAWSFNGVTDLHNLTLVCRSHHTQNDDTWQGKMNMGHAERDPETGRVGFAPPDGSGIRLNESAASEQSAGAKLRAAKQAASTESADLEDPDPGPEVEHLPGSDPPADPQEPPLFDIAS